MNKIKTLVMLCLFGGAAEASYAYDCSNVAAYKDGSAYANGSIEQNGGAAYNCTVGGWCSVGGPYAPGTGWAWTNAWSSLGACGATSSVSSVASSVVSSVKSSASSVVSSSVSSSIVSSIKSSAISSAGSCGTLPVWASASVYTGGTQVQANNVKYQAKWWTQGQDPATNSGADGVWTNQGPCGTASSSSVVSSIVSSKSSVSSVNSSIKSSVSSSSISSSIKSSSSSSTSSLSGKRVIGYFTDWGVYDRNYQVKNIETSGSAAVLTHIMYAFGNVTNGKCVIGDSYADYEMEFSAGTSVDGVADSEANGTLRGNFGQLRKLKKLHPGLKVVWSFGGWTWSGGFPQAAANPTAFAESCYNLVKDPRWADVFDGIDIDWEYPNECGLTCDTSSGRAGFKNLMQALRVRFGNNLLVTAAITAGVTKLGAADYAGAAQYVDFYDPMTYDFFGSWDATGPTAPHSPLYDYAGMPIQQFSSDSAIKKLLALGVPASKLNLGIGFYARGWTGVTQAAPGGSATGAAKSSGEEAGFEDYRVIKTSCPATGTVGGTAYAYCGNNWWGYDTPATLVGKMNYVNQQNLGGAFIWELGGDTNDGELIRVFNNIR